MPLCEKCKFIRLPHQPPTNKHSGWVTVPHTCLIRHHSTFAALLAAADAGCDVCLYFRPFIDWAILRRKDLAERSTSDCSRSRSFGNSHDDPFKPVDRGRETSDGGLVYSAEDGPRYHVGEDEFYEYDEDDDKYYFLLGDTRHDLQRIDEQEEQAKKDEELDRKELHERLVKLGLERRSALSSNGSSRGSRASPRSEDLAKSDAHSSSTSEASRGEEQNEIDAKTHDMNFTSRMQSTRADKFADIQWLLTTCNNLTGRDQLWMTIHKSENEPAMGDTGIPDSCVVTLTAGSVDSERLEEGPTFCLNGEDGYNIYTIAAMYPALWKYVPDELTMPQKRPGRNKRPILEFYQHRNETFFTTPTVHTRQVEEDPASEPVMELLRSWNDICKHNHKQCRLQEPSKTPTRLIYVGESSLNLHIPTEAEQGTLEYIALSHCWGKDPSAITKLLQINLNAMLKAIDENTLAKNFRDACTVTRGLKLNYLWIDALCIIQDNDADWAREASKMGAYYRHASLTISAISSPGAQHGFLIPRPLLPPPIKIEITSNTQPLNLYLRPPLPSAATITDPEAYTSFRNRIASDHLSTRAWCLQERLFSRRILHFTAEQAIWQCRSRFFTEDGQHPVDMSRQESLRDERDIVDIINLRARKPRRDSKDNKPPPVTVQSTQWFALVRAFMERNLTKQSDRLPAIGGLASEIHKLTNIPYHAGLWFGQRSILISLLWKPEQESSSRYRGLTRAPSRADYPCPTWSWASIDAEIQHVLADEAIVFRPGLDLKFLGCTTTPVGNDRFGAVEAGQLTLEVWIHAYAGLRTFREELMRDAETNFWAEQQKELRSEDADDPLADNFVSFDLPQPADLWAEEGEKGREREGTGYWVAFVAFVNEFEGEKDDAVTAIEYREMHFLVLREKQMKREKEKIKRRLFVRVGVAATESGTVFKVDEEHGWRRERIVVQ